VKRLCGLLSVGFIVAFASAGLAGASTTVAWQATFPETIGGPIFTPFSCPADASCGSGQVTGLGQAEDVIVFGACGPDCDVRTFTFADGGTIVMHESESNFQTPGNSQGGPGQARSYGNPFSIDLSDTIVGGTGRFTGASGSASGRVLVAGGTAQISLSGTVTF
jgi:hypothetical protein